MKTLFITFVDHWHQIAVIWAEIALAGALLVVLYYLLLLTAKSTLVKKYDFISTHEIKYLWYTGLCLSVSITFFLNSVIVQAHFTGSGFILAMKTFVSLIIGLSIASAIRTYLNVYYPFRLEKRLNTLRFKKRISPDRNEMRLLTEDEEDVHLTEAMIEHEKVQAYEYDVWLDDKSGYKKIEKYAVNRHLIICEKCNYRTSQDYNEEVLTQPTHSTEGEMVRHYRCSYCGHEQTKKSHIAALSSD